MRGQAGGLEGCRAEFAVSRKTSSRPSGSLTCAFTAAAHPRSHRRSVCVPLRGTCAGAPIRGVTATLPAVSRLPSLAAVTSLALAVTSQPGKSLRSWPSSVPSDWVSKIAVTSRDLRILLEVAARPIASSNAGVVVGGRGGGLAVGWLLAELLCHLTVIAPRRAAARLHRSLGVLVEARLDCACAVSGPVSRSANPTATISGTRVHTGKR